MKSILGRQLTLVLFASQVAFASEVTTISLKPILDQLSVEDMVSAGIPIRSREDVIHVINNSPGAPKSVWRSMGIYPISHFAATEDGQLLAVIFHQAVVPEGSGLEDKIVLIRLDQNKTPHVEKVITTGIIGEQAGFNGVEFIGNRYLRGAATYKYGTNGDYRRTYVFFDPQTGMKKSFLDLIPILEPASITALSDRHYLVRTTPLGGEAEGRFFRIDPATLRVKELGIISGTRLVLSIERGVLEKGRDVAHLDDETTVVKAGYDSPRTIVRVGPEGVAIDKQVYFPAIDTGEYLIENGKGMTSRSHDHVVSVGARTWSLEDYVGPLTRVEGGYVAEYGNDPSYGFSFLSDTGEVRLLSPSAQHRLVHSHVYGSSIVGMGILKANFDVDFVTIGVTPQSPNITGNHEPSPHARLAGYPKPYPVMFELSNGRYLLVKISKTEIGVVSVFMDEQIIKSIIVEDSDKVNFRVEGNSLIVNQVSQPSEAVYSMPSFRYFRDRDCIARVVN